MVPSLFVDLHYTALCGAGWTSSDPGGVYSTTANGNVSAGVYDIPVSGNYGLNPGMLLVYQGLDGEFYPFRIVSSSSSLLKSDRQLPVGMSSGAIISNAYNDDAHPNANGGAMVADSALRQLATPKKEIEVIQREGWTATGGASVSFAPQSSYMYPGSDIVGERAATVTSSSAGAGVVGAFVSMQGGDYVLRIPMSTGNRGAGIDNTIAFCVDERKADYSTVQVASVTKSGYDQTDAVNIPVYVPYGSSLRVRVTCPNSGPWSFYVGQIEFHRVRACAPNLNTGKHVLFGDSWVTPGSPIANRVAARLSGATVVAKGVGGNKASQLISRFASDVTPESPDYVWVVVGTNDYYSGVSPATFEGQISQLKQMIIDIGATPILFNPSVGAITFSPSQLLPSRRYTTYVRYWDLVAPIPDVSASPWRSDQICLQDVLLQPMESKVIWVSAWATKQSAFIHLFLSNTPLCLSIGFSAHADGDESTSINDFDASDNLANRWIHNTQSNQEKHLAVRVKNQSADSVAAAIVFGISLYKYL